MAIFYLSGDLSTGPKTIFLFVCAVYVFVGHHFYIQAKLVINFG